MPMKMIFVFILSVLFSSIQISAEENRWTYDLYEAYNHRDFRSLELFHQEFDSENPDIPLLNAALFFLTNEYRVKNRRDPLKHHIALETASYFHSREMAERDFFSHINNINRDRGTTLLRAGLAGISNPFIAENILYEYYRSTDTYLDLAERMIKLWINSRTHRENMLSRDGLQMGCGVFIKGERVYATQKFQWFHEVIEKEAVDKMPDFTN